MTADLSPLSDADLDRLDERSRRTPTLGSESMPMHPGDVAALVAEVREHRAERAAQLSGQIVAASLEDGVTALAASCSDDECECPEHDVAAPPRGTYATVRLDDEDQGVGFWRVRLVREGVGPNDHE